MAVIERVVRKALENFMMQTVLNMDWYHQMFTVTIYGSHNAYSIG